MTVRDRRRAPFAYQELSATAAIRDAFAGQQRMAALAIYQSMTEIANEHRDREFEARRAEVAERAGCSPDTLDRYASRFVELDLIEVERRQQSGVHLPNLWTLLTPDTAERGSRTSAATPRTSAPTPSRTSAATPPHVCGDPLRTSAATTRARETGQEVRQEERLESADADSSLHEKRASAPGEDPGNSLDQARALWRDLGDEREQQAIRSLIELAEQRSLTDGWNPTAALELIRGEFRNRDFAGEAARFRDFYSPGGIGENREIRNLVSRWREWLKRAPSLDTLTGRQRPTVGRRRRGRGGAAPATPTPTSVPCTLTGPEMAGEAARRWEPIVVRLKTAVSEATWHLYLDALHLHGVQDGQLVIAAPAENCAWITERFSRLLAAAAEQPIRLVPCDGPPDLLTESAAA